MTRRTLSEETRGILLAGTHPWNSTFDSLVPRTLLPVAHRPLIWYGLSWLGADGIREVSVCGNREARLLRSRLERHVPPGMTVSYHEDPMPRGAAGSARDAALATDAQTFVIADGTAIPTVDLSDLLTQHRVTGACVTVVVHAEARRNSSPLPVPSGVYVFDRRAFDVVPVHGFFDIKESLIPLLHSAGEHVLAYESALATPRVLDASTYLAVNEWMIERIVRQGGEDEGYVRSGDALVHRDALVSDGASLVGPVLVGPGARILSGAVVVGPTSIGREAAIASGAMVSRSAIWRRSAVGRDAIADRCIVADDAVLESASQSLLGIVTAERDGDSEPDWVAQQALQLNKRQPRDLGTRLGRLVFGAGWSRSAAQ
jgi:NDP-sugar pyrophosphorylase family protein